GKILETGGPKDIYLEPKSKTVAEFIGNTNFINGELTKDPAKNGFYMVSTPIANLYSKIPADMKDAGGKITLCIRPEHIDVHAKQPSDNMNVLKGKVTSAVFLGEYTEYRVDVKGQLIRAHSYGAHPVEEGETAYLQAPPDRFTVLKFE
ncbi:MAG: TOBE domain-containing protein, partial [Thaumarchaeota archaeon]|nr:TOBE domain-containing protein [Nitrososphaerota archaeon]